MNSDVAYALGQRAALQHLTKQAVAGPNNGSQGSWWNPYLALSSPGLYAAHLFGQRLYGKGGALAASQKQQGGEADGQQLEWKKGMDPWEGQTHAQRMWAQRGIDPTRYYAQDDAMRAFGAGLRARARQARMFENMLNQTMY